MIAPCLNRSGIKGVLEMPTEYLSSENSVFVKEWTTFYGRIQVKEKLGK